MLKKKSDYLSLYYWAGRVLCIFWYTSSLCTAWLFACGLPFQFHGGIFQRRSENCVLQSFSISFTLSKAEHLMYWSYLQVFFCKLPVSLAYFSFFNQFIGFYLLDFRRAFSHMRGWYRLMFSPSVCHVFSALLPELFQQSSSCVFLHNPCICFCCS